jgi:hypothetical protein
LATGQASAQGQDKLNIRDLGNGTDVIMPASDFAEDFAVEASEAIEPGAVVVLDGNGVLRASHKSYDKKVAHFGGW